MTRLKYILSLIAAAATGFGAMAGQASSITVRATADSTNLVMGDRAKVRVEVVTDRQGGELVDVPTKPFVDFYGLEFQSCAIDTTDLGNGRTQIGYDLQFQAFAPNELLTMPGFNFVVDGDTATSDILVFKVLPVELSPELGDIENIDSLTIHPQRTVASIPARWYDYVPDWWIWVLLGLIVAGLGIAFAILYKKNGPNIFVARKPIPPYELAMQRLKSLKEQHLAEAGQVKEYYTLLTDILRSYLEGRFGIYAMEMTSTQIVKHLRENPDTNLSAEQIRQVLELADFVKFAGMRPIPEDHIRTYNTILRFVEDTKPEPETEENDKTEPSNNSKN